MNHYGLYVILTAPTIGHEAMTRLCVEAGVRIVQLREKGMKDGELLDLARKLTAITHGTATRFVINDRADIAMLSGADGVHVGQGDISVADARRIVGPDAIVGLSTHTIEQATEAQSISGVDYIGFGPVYPTTTKLDADPVVGTDRLAQVVALSQMDVIAIGGIFPENIETVLSSGARSFSLVRYLMEPDSEQEVLRRIGYLQSMADKG